MNKLKQRITAWLSSRKVTWRTVGQALGIGVALGLLLALGLSTCSQPVSAERDTVEVLA